MNDTRDGIVDLFPTRMLQRNLLDFEAPNRELLKLVRDLEKTNRNLTIDYRDNNLLNLDHPGANWLRGEVNNSVILYMQSVCIDTPVDWQINSWATINRLGDYHDLHKHPHSYLSGSSYVKVPRLAEAGRRKDLRPNRITFYDPRPGINMGSIRNDPYVDPEFTILPAWAIDAMANVSQPFCSSQPVEGDRVSVSFNIILKWADHYLPSQE